MSDKTALHLLSARYRNAARAEDCVAWAVQELIEGQDSDALRMLASLAKPSDWWQVEPLLERAYAELNYPWPDAETCHWQCAEDLARDIVANAIAPEDGAGRIWQLCHALGYPDSLLAWDFVCADIDPESYRDIAPEELPEIIHRAARELLAQHGKH